MIHIQNNSYMEIDNKDKDRYLTQSYEKSPFTHQKTKSNMTTQNATKHLNYTLVQRLRTDLGWSVGVTTANKWFD